MWHACNASSVYVTPFTATAAVVGNFSISSRIINVKTMTAKYKRVLNKNGSNVEKKKMSVSHFNITNKNERKRMDIECVIELGTQVDPHQHKN